MTNLDTQRHDYRDGSRKIEYGSCDKNLAFFATNLASFVVKPSQRLTAKSQRL